MARSARDIPVDSPAPRMGGWGGDCSPGGMTERLDPGETSGPRYSLGAARDDPSTLNETASWLIEPDSPTDDLGSR